MTIEQAIEQYDEYANVCMCHNLTVSQKEFEQLAAWLRELVERRKMPEIITCGECKHYKIDHPKANGYHCCYRCHNIFPMKETDFCSRAERRTDGQRTSD